MAPDVLNKKVVRRLEELGLPACLVDIEEFRNKFFLHQWVMFVRDSDNIANVHLVEPQEGKRALGNEHGGGHPTNGKDRVPRRGF